MNMKILLIITATLLFAIGGYTQEKNVGLNSFIPKGKGIYKKISSKVVITKAKFGLHEYPDEIYFSDATGNLKSKIEILPGNIGNPNKVNVFYSKKYLGVYRNYRAKNHGTEDDILKEDFIVLNSTGDILWETKGDSLKYAFFNDNSDSVSLLDPYSGSVDEYSVYGKFHIKKKYSEWTEKYFQEEESPVKSKYVVSDDAKHIAISRIAATKKEAFYELTLLVADGSVIFQKRVAKLDGWVDFISTGKKMLIVYESNYTSNLQANGKILKQYSGYDFAGNKIWSRKDDNISFDGHFSDDGTEYLFLNDKAKMDLGTGKITR